MRLARFHAQGMALLMAAGCVGIDSKVPLDGKLGPYELKTTVDSGVARYYAEDYLLGTKADPDLDAKIDLLHKGFENAVPEREDLKRIARDYSVDFAALFWGQQTLSIPRNRDIQRQFVDNLGAAKSGKAKISSGEYLVMLAPGLDYRENGKVTGADLKGPMDLLRQRGVRVHFIEIPPMGTVEENASMIAEAIRAQPKKKILIGGPSSAGPAIHLALAKLLSPSESAPVAAWVSLGGVIKGSPVLDWVDSGIRYPAWRLALWFKGWKQETFKSLRADVSRERAASLKVPDHIKVISYVGLSLSGDISKFAKDKYCIMHSEGPNDGLALLPDMVVPNSYTIIAPASDHFFAEDPLINEKTIALLKTAIDLL